MNILKNFELQEVIHPNNWAVFSKIIDQKFIKALYQNKKMVLDEMKIFEEIEKENPKAFKMLWNQAHSLKFKRFEISLDKLPRGFSPDVIEMAGAFMLDIKEVPESKLNKKRMDDLIKSIEKSDKE